MSTSFAWDTGIILYIATFVAGLIAWRAKSNMQLKANAKGLEEVKKDLKDEVYKSKNETKTDIRNLAQELRAGFSSMQESINDVKICQASTKASVEERLKSLERHSYEK